MVLKLPYIVLVFILLPVFYVGVPFLREHALAFANNVVNGSPKYTQIALVEEFGQYPDQVNHRIYTKRFDRKFSITTATNNSPTDTSYSVNAFPDIIMTAISNQESDPTFHKQLKFHI